MIVQMHETTIRKRLKYRVQRDQRELEQPYLFFLRRRLLHWLRAFRTKKVANIRHLVGLSNNAQPSQKTKIVVQLTADAGLSKEGKVGGG
jgi:hypothetical protein